MLSWCHRFSTWPFCEATTRSHKLECSETVQVPQSAVIRYGGRCLCRDAEALSHHSKKRESLSLVESFVRSQIVCLVRIVFCELRLGSKP